MERAISKILNLGVAFALFALPSLAVAEGGFICNRGDRCNAKGAYTKKSPGPTKGDAVRLNPAAVPVEAITGIETIYFDSSFDFALVKGLGRVGAAISPSNSEGTFFGPPAIETYPDSIERLQAQKKFKSSKYSLAGAVNLASKDGQGFGHYDLSLGIMGRYNSATSKMHPGAGLQAILGPIALGGAVYEDDTTLNTGPYVSVPQSFNMRVMTLSAGLSFESLMLDYSLLEVLGDVTSKTSVITAGLFIGRSILTVSQRKALDMGTTIEDEYFGGAQYRVAPFLVLGGFYNYYLLREISFGATLFF